MSEYIMYILMALIGGYLMYASRNLQHMDVQTKYDKQKLMKLYYYTGISFIVLSIVSVMLKHFAPQYEIIAPICMAIVLIYLNLKYRKKKLSE